MQETEQRTVPMVSWWLNLKCTHPYPLPPPHSQGTAHCLFWNRLDLVSHAEIMRKNNHHNQSSRQNKEIENPTPESQKSKKLIPKNISEPGQRPTWPASWISVAHQMLQRATGQQQSCILVGLHPLNPVARNSIGYSQKNSPTQSGERAT